MTGAAGPWLQQAARQLNGGDFTGAWNSYMAALQAEPGNDQAWLGLGLAALLRRDWAAIVGLADRRQARTGDGFAWFHDVTSSAMGYGLGVLVEVLGNHLDPSSTYAVSQLYHAACARLQADDEDGAFVLLNRLKPLLAQHRDSLPNGPGDRFNIAWRQATLVEDGDYPDTLSPSLLNSRAADLPEPRLVGTWGDGDTAEYVLLAACDGKYLDRFGADYLDSAARMGPGGLVHLHVVEADDDAVADFCQLAARAGMAVAVSVEGANPWRSGAYYACSRFLVAAWVKAQHGGKPLMATDIDIRFIRPLAELVELARPFAFASFLYEAGLGPASRLPAVWTWFAGPDGDAMLDSLRKVLLSKLDVPWPHNWMLDQAGLMCARRWLRRARPAAAIGEVNRLGERRYFTDFLECRGDEDDKAALIRQAGQSPS
ncbi:MAG: hypothetical protein AB7G62_05490 [Magnetospirillum sp.]